MPNAFSATCTSRETKGRRWAQCGGEQQMTMNEKPHKYEGQSTFGKRKFADFFNSVENLTQNMIAEHMECAKNCRLSIGKV